MFAFNLFKSRKEIERELEISLRKKAVRDLLHDMQGTAPEEAARLVEKLKVYLQNDTLIPFDFRQKAFKRARVLECEANMRIADRLLFEAAALMDPAECYNRGRKLAESRTYFGKACLLGVDDDWKRAYQRLVETIMLSGRLRPANEAR